MDNTQSDFRQSDFNLYDSGEIGQAIITLKTLTKCTASRCADMIFSQDTEAKTLLFGNSNGSSKGVIPAKQ